MQLQRIRRGFFCAVRGCTSKPDGRVSFFYFPKDKKRQIEWIEACSRAELHEKNDKFIQQSRVCALHFEPKMFLNDLKNRLQPHAKPTILLAGQEKSTTTTTLNESSCSDNSLNSIVTGSTPSLSCSALPESKLSFTPTSTQTDQYLSATTPRKKRLQQQMNTMMEDNKKVKTEHNNHLDGITADDFRVLCEKFLPPSSVKFVQAQVSLNTTKENDKRYTDEQKKFALQLYSISPKAYKLEPFVEDATFRCTQCSHRADFQFQLDYHIEKNHKNVNAAELFHTITAPEPYFCIYCGFNSYHKLHLYEHSKQHDDVSVDKNIQRQFFEGFDTFSCDCEYQTQSSLCFVKHHASCCKIVPADASLRFKNALIESPLMNSEAIVKRFQCAQCPYKSKDKSNLRKHKIVHRIEEIRRFHCTKCSYRAKQKQHLKTHMLTHAGPEEIVWLDCDVCSYRTRVKGNLKKHLLTHTAPDEIVWFSCAECSYRSKHRRDLKRHMVVHAAADDIAWFSCVECSFRTREKGTLNKHAVRHAAADKIVWFNCTKCSYRAKVRKNMKRHMLTHASPDEIKWLHCGKCAYRAKVKHNLDSHMLTHAAADDVEWFDCAECSYRAKRKPQLKRHMLRHSRVKNK